MAFEVPVQGNARLSTILERMNSDEEVKALWKASNINAIDRLGFSDHGSTHVRIVARNALKMLRLLMEAGHQPGVVRNYALTKEDAEIVVVLAVHREDHDEFSIMLTPPILRR
ncbi:MAG TPA: hypothetical protein PLR51_05010, partial [Methanomassiliicoccales archaeon]|nr:hypothetical protein [Methanomassiliicoccales archaeon]